MVGVIIIDSVFKNYENYYPQVVLKECKYSDNEKKVIKYLTDDLKLIENSVYHASNVHFFICIFNTENKNFLRQRDNNCFVSILILNGFNDSR